MTPAYWKLNNSLLMDDSLNALIHENGSKGKYWELLKFELRILFMERGKKMKEDYKRDENELIAEIISLSSMLPENMSEVQKANLHTLQLKLDQLYISKAKGAFIRSRAKWLEEGEQNSSYFFKLEKQRQNKNGITHLTVNGSVVDNPKDIAKICGNFYETLYKSKQSTDEINALFNSLGEVRTIGEVNKKICDTPISITEIKDAIKKLKLNKSPGVDGLSSEFYKLFSEEIAPFLLNVFEESLNFEELPPSLNQGLITLIPKPQKDVLLLDNWHPISLLNNDYKIFALCLANKLKMVLNDIIDESQNGFMSGRYIIDNIRLVLDILDYSDLISDNSFILFLDFHKAFDSIEHQFLLKALDVFGFEECFKKSIRTLYASGNSSIKLPYGTTKRFRIERGIRQGCPVSPYLFLLPMQILSIYIKESSLKGISIAGRTISLSQLADDTTLFLQDRSQIDMAVKLLDKFSVASGLKLNLSKCELLPIKACNEKEISGIPVKFKVKYLGVIIVKDQVIRMNENFNPIISTLTQRFNLWLQRDLTITGRVLLSKAEGLSRFVYASSSLDISKDLYIKIDKILFDFIWKKKSHLIRRNVMINKLSSGGFNALDFSTLHSSFKIKWVKRYPKNPNSLWNFISTFVFEALGGLHFLLRCNYKIEKLPAKLSSFHKQLLLCWSLVYKHNFSPHKCYIWNNQDICFKHKTLFFKSWVDHNMLLVRQLFNKEGHMFTYEEFLSEFNFPVPPREYAIIFDAIPSGLKMLLSSSTTDISMETTPSNLYIGNSDPFLNSKTNNKCIRDLVLRNTICKPSSVFYWNNLYIDIDWKKTWSLNRKYCISNKVREVSLKILHRCYPVNTVIAKYRLNIDPLCSFCHHTEETINHMFWDCTHSQGFWQDLNLLLNRKLNTQIKFKTEYILFGCLDDIVSIKKTYIINFIILLAKFHIHTSKYSKQKPNLTVFLAYLKFYLDTLKLCTNPKAVKTRTLCDEFDLP